jgi:hypothetical protein
MWRSSTAEASVLVLSHDPRFALKGADMIVVPSFPYAELLQCS